MQDLVSRRHLVALWITVMSLAGCASPTASSGATPLPSEPSKELLLTPTRTLAPARNSSPSPTPTPMPTGTTLPSPTPTLGPPMTRTPAPAAQCPTAGSSAPISLSDPSDNQQYPLAIQSYLNKRGSAAGLQNALNALTVTLSLGAGPQQAYIKSEVFTQDVTGDTVADVVTEVAIPDPWGDTYYFFVHACRVGQYLQLTTERTTGQIQAIEDLNRNGVDDIVAGTVSVLEWDSEEFSTLPFGEPVEGSGEVRETDGPFYPSGAVSVGEDAAGNPKLLVTVALVEETFRWVSGLQRERTETWAWDGYRFALVGTDYAPPRYRIHAVYDGDDAARMGDYRKALAFYQQAISDQSLLGWSEDQHPGSKYAFFGYPATPTPDPQERLRLSAYAQYRVLVVHAAQSDLTMAQSGYQALQSEFPGASAGRAYADLAAAFWDEYSRSRSLTAACDRAMGFSLIHANSILIPLSSSFYGTSYYNQGIRDYLPEDICLSGGAALLPTLPPDLAAQCPPPSNPPPVMTASETMDGFNSQILAYLNAQGSAVGLRVALSRFAVTTESGWVAHADSFVVVRDVTGDGDAEVLVEFAAPERLASAIFVYKCQAGKYERIAVFDDEAYTQDPYADVRRLSLMAVKDMNANGVAEIAFRYYEAGQGCGSMNAFVCEDNVHIVEWDEEEFAQLALEQSGDGGLDDFIHAYFAAYLVTDTDANGTLELLFTDRPDSYVSAGWLWRVPVRNPPNLETWAWNGQAFTLANISAGPPIFRIHAVSDGDEASAAGEYAEALASYQRAIFDQSLMSWGPHQDGLRPQQRLGDPEELPRLSAYARYRIMLLHVVQNDIPAARIVYDTLQRTFPAGMAGHPYAELARAFWREYQASEDVAAACGMAIAYASTNAEEVLVPLGFDFYDPQGVDYGTFGPTPYAFVPEYTCPFS